VEKLAALGLCNLSNEEHARLQSLQQGGHEWHLARRMRITASDIPSIIGTPEANCQPNDVVQHKSFGQPTTNAMQHGIDSELTAAEAYK
jgi:hypothetical protein